VDGDVILPLAAVSLLTDLRVLKRFHNLRFSICRFVLTSFGIEFPSCTKKRFCPIFS
jgi:hypothetical protein